MTLLKWIGNVAIVIGLWKIGDKWRHAFLFSIAGESAWMLASALGDKPDWALFSICGVFNVMAIRNWIKWGKA